MYDIRLFCQNGASTGMLVEKMKEAAQIEGVPISVHAYPYSTMKKNIAGADIVLLAPQVRFKKAGLEKEYADYGIRFMVVETVDYGMMDGEKILHAVLQELKGTINT